MTEDFMPVPTAADLVAMGRDYAIAGGFTGKGTKADPHKPTGIRILQKGHDLMGEALRHNGRLRARRGEGTWHPEPPHTRTTD